MGERGAAAQLRWAIFSILAIAVTMAFLFPIYWSFSQSLRNPLDTFTVAGFGIPWINFNPTLGNWIDQVSTPETTRALYNSTIISICAAVLALILGTPAAYAIARFEFRTWKNTDITIWFLSQRILPPVATIIPFYLIMRYLNLLDTHLALILINATFVLPFVVVILRQTFLELPVELEESALVDGADHWMAFWRIALPLAAPTMAATGLIIFAFSWNEFLFAVAIGSQSVITVPVHIAGAVDTRGVQFWFMGVRAMVAIVPPVLIALIAQRYIVRGLTLGAVKG
ncbi:MAG TPA: carbohydrate ABC transporter permease [Geminicoccus sp.]|jgi:multiple sugar transport system permease protein|uniref:carbohydrate ABC transporter permease n=1 Tax=Geminicoccus sp. TaxID=2024832 RepID=UPI002E336ECC|nr:carbohydrate ABC transporter permease [Geminicoccus sp.]HEX2529281.1 carbohydrate ABC transporter permease [Geminicoccus sp.]